MTSVTSADSPTSRRSLLVLLGFLATCFVVAGIGGLATAGQVEGWYADADKPWFNPPNAVFGPTWTVLYVLIGVSGWLAYRAGSSLTPWWVQLALNLAWTPVFFGLELLWPGLAVILALDAAVIWTILTFRRHSRPAAWLLAPYLAWILFATCLNAAIAALN